MKRLLIFPLLIVLSGCTPIEKQAYNVIVGAKAFLDSEKHSHPECSPAFPVTLSDSQGKVCILLSKATDAKDLLIDATESYCSGSAFESGGPCQPPDKGTPAYRQAAEKLKEALANYQQIESDLKGVLK